MSDVMESIERLGASALEWKAKAERYETALMLIASHKGQTLLAPDDAYKMDTCANAYKCGARDGFEQLAGFATAALDAPGQNDCT